MARNIGEKCGIGHVGEDTGIVLLHTTDPRGYRIETAATERYLTDGFLGRILRNSKSNCDADDSQCRIIAITDDLIQKIEVEFNDKQLLQSYKEATTEEIKRREKEEFEDFIQLLTSLAGGLLILGGGFYANHRRKLRNLERNRLALLKKIENLNRALKKQLNSYEEWFQNAYTIPIMDDLHALEKDIVSLKNTNFNAEVINDKSEKLESLKKALTNIDQAHEEYIKNAQEEESAYEYLLDRLEMLVSELMNDDFIFELFEERSRLTELNPFSLIQRDDLENLTV